MSAIRRTVARIRAIFTRGDAADSEMRAEMQAHLDMAIDENIRRGMSRNEARRAAMLAAGGFTEAAERVREQRGLPWVEGMVADTRYAIRHFRRTPMSTLTMLLVLSLGIGTNVVLFTVLNSIVTMPAPGIARDASLVRIRGSMRMNAARSVQHRLLSWPEVQAYAERTDLFSSVAAYADETAVTSTGDVTALPSTASVIYATSNYFSVLGVRPAVGTEPVPEVDNTRLSASPTAMISYAMWQQQFGGARDVIGRTLRVNDVPVEIVGVAPRRFVGTTSGNRMTVWVPLAAYPLLQKRTAAAFISYDSVFLSAAARLRPGTTSRIAAPAVAGIAARAQGAQTRTGAQTGANAAEQGAIATAEVVPMLASNSRVSETGDLVISAAATIGFALLVLLITCTNVSALMVGLAVARRREIGVRLSLGAPRKRLVRQLLTESVLLALVAAVAGLVVTAIGIRVIGTALEDVQLVVDWRVTIATCVVAIGSGILLGVSPALHATRVSVGEVLKGSARSVGAAGSRLQRALVVAQIALTQPLLVGFGVMIATVVSDKQSETTSSASAQIVEIELDTWAGRASTEERALRIAAAVARVAAIPGVVAAMPMQMGTVTMPLAVDSADRVAGVTYAPAMQAQLTSAPPGYFKSFNIPIVRGRDFDKTEYAHSPNNALAPTSAGAVIVGDDLARRLWGTADPIGRRLVLPSTGRSGFPPLVVVGVVDAKVAGPSAIKNRTRVYVPYAEMNTGVIARTSGPALPVVSAMRQAVASEVPQMPIYRAETMAQREARGRRSALRTSAAVAAAGALTLMLSAIGLYAVMSFAVGQRTREIGIRTALGAQQGQVVRMFFGKGLVLGGFGLVIGLPLSMIAMRVIVTTLNWSLASPPLLGAAIAVVMLAVASIAVWIPARRASAVDPVVALRVE